MSRRNEMSQKYSRSESEKKNATRDVTCTVRAESQERVIRGQWRRGRKRQYCGWREIFLFNKLRQKFKSVCQAIAEFYFRRHSGNLSCCCSLFFPLSYTTSIAAIVIEWHNELSGTQSTCPSACAGLSRELVQAVSVNGARRTSHVILTCYTSVCPASIIYLVLFVNLSRLHIPIRSISNCSQTIPVATKKRRRIQCVQ